MFSFDFNTSTIVKIVIFTVVYLRCSGYIVYLQIQRSVRIGLSSFKNY